MSGTEISTLLVLLAVCAGCLGVLLVVALLGTRRLRRIELLLEERGARAAPKASAAGAGVSAPRGEFEAFLTEDPARQMLPKGEQFKAYRRWRQEKGLNWSKP